MFRFRQLSPGVRQAAGIWLAWTAAGVFYVTQDSATRLYRNDPVPWQQLFVGWMAAMYICAALTPAMLWAGRRWPLDRQDRRWRHAALHLGLSAIFSVASASLEAPVLLALGVFPSVMAISLTARAVNLVVFGFHGGVIRYWAVIGLQAFIRSREQADAREREALELEVRTSALAEQLTAAKLSALKMQLQPHFLFNTLGAIMVLVQRQQRNEAEAMLARLSDLLRLVVDDVDTQEVPLWRELDVLKLYLSIEQVRFQDRLRVRIAADPDTTDGLVPHMVLQPIVENAVRHGLGQSEDEVCIDVDAIKRDGCLVLTVSDDGAGSPDLPMQGQPLRGQPLQGQAQRPGPGQGQGKGIGLSNTRHRLQALYDGAATLLVEHRSPRGVRVTVTLPFHVAPEDEASWA